MNYKVFISGVDTDKIPKLSNKESSELIARAKNGDDEARKRFLYCNQRLVLSILHRFDFQPSLADDVFQVGCLGLTKAYNNFNLKYGVMFSTYAVPMIIGEIRRFLRENTSVKVSRKMRDVAYKVMQSRNKFSELGLKEPTLTEIAADVDIPVSLVCEALDAISDPISLYEPAFSDGEDVLVMDQIADKTEKESNWVDRIDLEAALSTLNEKERQIIDLRYYEGKTQSEVSKSCNVSQAQVSRLENSAVKKLRAYLES
ncbi:MAG: sigma-70 family RNA polymerase sigma factor [Clostridia bacterium]|nr:sigma-70 family RNA polymerase sigma factor [Clostridia bacterium]